MKGTPVAEPQFEILRVGRIKKPEPDETSRDPSNRSGGSVHDDGVTPGSVSDIKSAQRRVVVFNRSIGVQRAILQDKRQIVDANVRGSPSRVSEPSSTIIIPVRPM